MKEKRKRSDLVLWQSRYAKENLTNEKYKNRLQKVRLYTQRT